jgi:cyclopropane fatty-acyl-phospholipid synthase-like methyltransferase
MHQPETQSSSEYAVLRLAPRLLTPHPVFPGGFLPTLTLLFQTLREGSGGRLTVDSVANIGPHYARTLREWRRRFLQQFDAVIVPALRREYPAVMNGARGREEIEVFKRKWICMSLLPLSSSFVFPISFLS